MSSTLEKQQMLHPTRIDLPEAARGQLVELLQSSLTDAIDLKLQSKQAHWNVKGPSFISLHELFDSIAGIVEGFTDELAERITALGGIAVGTSQRVGSGTSLPEYPIEIANGADHVRALAMGLATFGKGLREAIDKSESMGDAVTADLYTGMAAEIDKQLWFVEAHVQADG